MRNSVIICFFKKSFFKRLESPMNTTITGKDIFFNFPKKWSFRKIQGLSIKPNTGKLIDNFIYLFKCIG